MKSVIIDNKTKEKIPYVNIWVENETIGTTSNEKGEFELKIDSPKIILFSALGFETKRILSDSIKQVIELKPQTTKLDEIIISSKKQNKSLTIGKFKKSKINHYFAFGKNPWIAARFFEYQAIYESTPYLSKIRILTKSKVKGSKFNIRLYDINEKGEPDNYIFHKNIIGTANKGKRITEIDISELNIKFPKNGFFIAFECLIIEDNKYEFNYTIKDSKEKQKGIRYDPKIGLIPRDENKNSWIFNQGKWRKVLKNNNYSSKRYNNKYNQIAIELTLKN
ncbi:carboxypeptidase-like regulatory domain-containing protein [Tenacibaculum geojense]|uniref:carboxypeptidase-like regulatory domain-containing protein n=1 Tax=Tenacibaculum geojense TaxID=915352 RepID=UPI0036DD9DA4